MNYIEQINGFWAKAENANISGNDIAVYMAILKYCNSLNWLNPFICHWEIICQYSKVSKNTYYKSLETLSKEKFIEYQKGQRNKFSAKIVVLKFENNKGTIKEQHEEQHEEQQGNLYKPINNKTYKPINKDKSFNFRFALMSLGISENIVKDYLAVRKTKRATNTETAFNGLKTQIEKSKLSAQECIEMAVENSWAGFKADWIINKQIANGQKKAHQIEKNDYSDYKNI